MRYICGNKIMPVYAPNERWSLDFMHDTLANARKIRTLMVIGDFTREGLATPAATSFSSKAQGQQNVKRARSQRQQQCNNALIAHRNHPNYQKELSRNHAISSSRRCQHRARPNAVRETLGPSQRYEAK